MTNGTLTALALGFAIIVASADPLPGPRGILEEPAANPATPFTTAEGSSSANAEPTETTNRTLVSYESKSTANSAATERLARSATSDFAAAVRDATTAIAAVDGEENVESVDQWPNCVGWDRIILFHCWWYCTRPNYFCPCVTCWFSA